MHYILLYLQYVWYDTSHSTACIRWSPPSRVGQSKRRTSAMLEVSEALFVSVYNSCIFQSFCWGSSSSTRLIICLGGAPANIPPRRMTKQESQALTAVQSFDSSSSCCCFPRWISFFNKYVLLIQRVDACLVFNEMFLSELLCTNFQHKRRESKWRWVSSSWAWWRRRWRRWGRPRQSSCRSPCCSPPVAECKSWPWNCAERRHFCVTTGERNNVCEDTEKGN